MALVLDARNAAHVRSGRYAQRERPAATIPARLRVARACPPASPTSLSPLQALLGLSTVLLWRAFRPFD